MRVLIVGSGAREHAIAWKLSRERSATALICAPGNPGMADIGRCVAVDPGRPEALLALALQEDIDLTVVGPELPLSLGVVDRFVEQGLMIFGPSADAARLESSKVFAKDFMARHGIPTARFRVCHDAAEALTVVASGELGWPLVIKADGLAAGKGVVVAMTLAEAEAALDMMFGGGMGGH